MSAKWRIILELSSLISWGQFWDAAVQFLDLGQDHLLPELAQLINQSLLQLITIKKSEKIGRTNQKFVKKLFDNKSRQSYSRTTTLSISKYPSNSKQNNQQTSFSLPNKKSQYFLIKKIIPFNFLFPLEPLVLHAEQAGDVPVVLLHPVLGVVPAAVPARTGSVLRRAGGRGRVLLDPAHTGVVDHRVLHAVHGFPRFQNLNQWSVNLWKKKLFDWYKIDWYR